MQIRLRSWVSLVAVLAMSMGLVSSASAGGIAVARFGGEHGNPTATNPSVIYYNPAGLAFESGYRLMIDANLALRSATYTRPEDAISRQPASDVDIAANAGEGSVDNFLVSPFIGFATDFGTDAPFAVGVGFFAPFGGKSVWDQVAPVDGAPGGAIDGPQRWYVTEGTIQTLAISLAAAYRIPSLRLSIGLAGNLYMSDIDTIRARNTNGSDDITTEAGGLQEGRSWLVGSSTDIGLGGGVLWEAVENTFWVGASYQSQPGFGEIQLEGTLDNLLAAGQPAQSDMIITQSLPDIVRLGFRYRPADSVELRLFGDYTRWSTFENQCIVGGSVTDVEAVCTVGDDGAQTSDSDENSLLVQNLVRRWEDTFGVRVGGSYWLLDGDLELLVGGGFDSNAIPDESLEPALQDYDKATATLGGTYQITDWFAASVSATNVFYFERDTRGVETAERFSPASRQPNSSGVYNQNVFLINTNLSFTFGGSDSDEEMIDDVQEDLQEEVEEEVQES